MTKRIDDGGPAFAHAVATVDGNGNPLTISDVERNPVGMSQRDWFAGLAMQAYVSGHISHHGHQNYWDPKGIADSAYEVADAMLAARKAGA